MTIVKPVNPWALPDGTLLLSADAERADWLAARRKGLGSSDAALLMGVGHADDSEYKMWLDKTGRAEPEAQTEAMRRGVWLEPHVVDFFRQQTGLEVRRCGLVQSKAHDIMLATPDRLVGDGGLLEVKTIGAFAKVAKEWRDGGIARHAYVQGMWQASVTGRTHVWFAAYAIDKPPMIRGPIERDEPLIERMINRAEFWWNTYVKGDTPPPVDLDRLTDEEIGLRWPAEQPGTTVESEWPAYVRQMLTEREHLKDQEKQAADRVKEIDRALKAEIGNAEALLIGDRPVITLKTYNSNASVNPELEVDYPEIWDKYIKRGTHRRIHIVKGWQNA